MEQQQGYQSMNTEIVPHRSKCTFTSREAQSMITIKKALTKKGVWPEGIDHRMGG